LLGDLRGRLPLAAPELELVEALERALVVGVVRQRAPIEELGVLAIARLRQLARARHEIGGARGRTGIGRRRLGTLLLFLLGLFAFGRRRLWRIGPRREQPLRRLVAALLLALVAELLELA